ncbi:formimidoylglutamate deiminase [Pseudoxanthomonas suwonensis]|uniref:formimidoylglutamate deiminase n=1 Tax=Pseudoxanthomonas suwonensis TaxID=314722 RepID=UPI000490A1FA|nr:formimidoylglutamate deiminase [Pseudoxanthomonas suwonensis]
MHIPSDASLMWTRAGWRRDAAPAVEDGCVAAPPAAGGNGGWVLPGIPNLHSHAFQRAMAGLAERQTHPQDSFWTWREAMYRIAARFDPDSLYAVAAQLYVEMLEAGFTTVCEFHYLHHAPDGSAYADPAAMSQALVAAARDTGIRLTLLPVLYMTGGFDRRPLSARQRRFGHDLEGFLRLFGTLRAQEDATLRVGVAFHSLRAVPAEALSAALAALPADIPLHIHIAEQVGEVQDCLAVRNARPVEWLLANAPVDAGWTLVHATHLTADEVAGIARSGATVALCPTTEANLGDGLFPLRDYLAAGGRWGVGSDSHISVSPVEELRWLEYGQRLQARRRNMAAGGEGDSVGEALLRGTLASGAQATGQPVGELAPGMAADWIVLDTASPVFAGAREQDVVDRWLFSGNRPLVRDVYVAGEQVVSDGRHRDREAIAARYRVAVERLLAD